MGTFGFLLVIHFLKIIVVFALSGLRKINKEKFKFFQKQVRDQTFFDDILKISLFGFIEIGAASLLTLTTPHTNREFTFVNIFLGVIIVLELFIGLPLTYSLILGQEMNVYRRKSFQDRWSTFIFGIKILDRDSW
jgi:hypothetical protein